MNRCLRKVLYSHAKPEFVNDSDLQKKNEEMSRPREGYFHRWIEEVDTSGEIPCIQPWALIENAENGDMEVIPYFCVTFNDKPE